MRQKSGILVPVFLGLAVLVIGGGIALMSADIPAPSQPVEKELDAKTFPGASQ